MMLDAKTARKIAKTGTLADAALAAAEDVPDWVKLTDPSGWDLEVLENHAKALEAAGCHLRRLLKDPEIVKLAS